MSEKRLLQIAVAIASLVPILGGGFGVWQGLAMLGVAEPAAAAESHFRYLSGLLLGIGLCFAAMVPRIEFRSAGFRLLAIVVVIGGSARLLSVALHGTSDRVTLFALVMELVVTPSLALWQMRVATTAR
jgi:hypothetical protein